MFALNVASQIINIYFNDKVISLLPFHTIGTYFISHVLIERKGSNQDKQGFQIVDNPDFVWLTFGIYFYFIFAGGTFGKENENKNDVSLCFRM